MSHALPVRVGTFTKSAVYVPLALVLWMFAGASRAEAVCIDKTAGALGKSAAAPRFEGGAFGFQAPESDVSIVGLWHIEFRLGNGDLYDEGFEQWHSDGTELTLDNAIPPAFGNICLGVWKKTGARSVKLTHVGWNWDVNQKPAGQFWLWMTATVDRRGRVFTGEFRTDSFDLDGNVIPELHAEGTVRAVRISVD